MTQSPKFRLSSLLGLGILGILSGCGAGGSLGGAGGALGDVSSGSSNGVSVRQEGEVLARALPPVGAGVNDRCLAGSRYLVFSTSNALVAEDTDTESDVYVRDLQSGATQLISRQIASGTPGASMEATISSDARYVAFRSLSGRLSGGSDTNNRNDIFVWDRDSGNISQVTPPGANGHSVNPVISADGNTIAFSSQATNLIGGNADTNRLADVFVWKRATNSINRVSLTFAGGQLLGGNSTDPALSSDGRFVAYVSNASNSPGHTGATRQDIYRVDLNALLSSTTLVSVNDDDVTLGNGNSWIPSMSADGDKILFASNASSLVSGDNNGLRDVFLRVMTSGQTLLVSGKNGVVGDGSSETACSLSPDGRWAAFASASTNLVADGNGLSDVYVRDLNALSADPVRASLSDQPVSELNGMSDLPAFGSNSDFLAFRTKASNVLSTDNNNFDDIYVRDLVRTSPRTLYSSMPATRPFSLFDTATWDFGVFE